MASGDLIAYQNVGGTSLFRVTSAGLVVPAAGVQPAAITDPGASGAIPVTHSGPCALTDAGAETRTMAIPTFLGQWITLFLDTSTTSVTLTVAVAFNEAGNNTVLFDSVGEAIRFEAISIAGVLVWREMGIDGATPSTV